MGPLRIVCLFQDALNYEKSVHSTFDQLQKQQAPEVHPKGANLSSSETSYVGTDFTWAEWELHSISWLA